MMLKLLAHNFENCHGKMRNEIKKIIKVDTVIMRADVSAMLTPIKNKIIIRIISTLSTMKMVMTIRKS